MDIKGRCIVLRCVKYRDTKMMVSLLSRQGGRLTVSVSVGSSHRSSPLRALLMPGAVIECVVDIRPGRDVHRLVECRGVEGFDTMAGGGRSMLVWWVCDLVDVLTRQGDSEPLLYDYIETSLALITTKGSVAWGAVVFMVGLMDFMGIRPDTGSWCRGAVFDYREGIFRLTPPLTGRWLDAVQSRIARAVLDMRWDNVGRYRWSRQLRAAILDELLAYYATHLEGMGQLRSLDILRSL